MGIVSVGKKNIAFIKNCQYTSCKQTGPTVKQFREKRKMLISQYPVFPFFPFRCIQVLHNHLQKVKNCINTFTM